MSSNLSSVYLKIKGNWKAYLYINFSKYFWQIPYFTDSTTLRAITRTLIFQQLKKNIFTIFIIRLQSQTKKKFLVYKTEPNFKISENRHFFRYSLLARQSRMVFLLVEGRNAAQLLCFHVLLHMVLPFFQFIARIIWISFIFFSIQN